MVHITRARPRMVSNETREVLVDAIESKEIASYVVAARQQIRDDNPFLFITLEDAHDVLYGQPAIPSKTPEYSQKTQEIMARSFLAGAYIASIAYYLDDHLPFMSDNTIDTVLARQQRDSKTPELNWFDAVLADSNLSQVVAASEEMLSQWHPLEAIERLQTGAGFLSAIVNEAVVISN